jgi:hypothetical protein
MPTFVDRVEIPDVRVLRHTDKAILVDFGDRQEWIPQSQIDDDNEVWAAGQEGTLIISEWLATAKGLV